MWPEFSKQGSWVPLKAPFGSLLTAFASSLAARKLPAELEEIESTWIFECERRLSPLSGSTGATVLCWAELAAARREFLARLNTIRRDLASVDRANEELRRMDLRRLLGQPISSSPRVRGFVRSIFLSGNGSLVFNNSFVQWGASEALRRVQPQVLLACFGIRQKLKPFSSVVLFEDQSRSNPVADEKDPAGSLVDGLLLSEYVHFAAERAGSSAGPPADFDGCLRSQPRLGARPGCSGGPFRRVDAGRSDGLRAPVACLRGIAGKLNACPTKACKPSSHSGGAGGFARESRVRAVTEMK